MASFISDNRDALAKRHYIRKAGAQAYWFDFSANKLNTYQARFSNNFCLVIYGSEDTDDAYVMPYGDVSAFFSKELLDNRQRWIGNIRNNIIHLSPGSRTMSVSAYYNAFDLLEEDEMREKRYVEENKIEYDINNDFDEDNIIKRINFFNQQYSDTKPYRRHVVSEQIARPSIITDYLKELLEYTCQLCHERGFMQANGIPYIETHHIIELHKLIAGSYCSDNIVIVCANCHRKLHYANVRYHNSNQSKVTVHINGVEYEFTRTLLSSRKS